MRDNKNLNDKHISQDSVKVLNNEKKGHTYNSILTSTIYEGFNTQKILHTNYLSEGRDETAQAYNTTVSKEFGDLSHSSYVLLTILFGEAQVFIQTSPYVVTVEAVCRDS